MLSKFSLFEPMDSSFDSVEQFLQKAREAKAGQRPNVTESVRECVNSDTVAGVPPAIADILMEHLDKYGDETLRSVGLYCIGKWSQIHMQMMDELVKKRETPALLTTCRDLTRLTSALELLDQVKSFGGPDEWREMLCETLVGAITDAMNERGEN